MPNAIADWLPKVKAALEDFENRHAYWPKALPRPKLRDIKVEKNSVSMLVVNQFRLQGPWAIRLEVRVDPLHPDSGILVGDGGQIDGHLLFHLRDREEATMTELFAHVLDDKDLAPAIDTIIKASWITGLFYYEALKLEPPRG